MSSNTPCLGFGKGGHGKEQCYFLHPELMWWKSANSVEEETAVALGSLEKDDRVISKPALRPVRVATLSPKLETKNRFDALVDEETECEAWGIGSLDIVVLEVNQVAQAQKGGPNVSPKTPKRRQGQDHYRFRRS